MKNKLILAIMSAALIQLQAGAADNQSEEGSDTSALISKTDIAKKTPMAHSSSIVEIRKGRLLCAWFGGESENDPSCQIWGAFCDGSKWGESFVIANNKDYAGEETACWNPVLLKLDNKLICFYKMGGRPYTWWGRYRVSTDGGLNWVTEQGNEKKSYELPAGIIGPVKNQGKLLANGSLIIPSSFETHNPRIWNVYVYIVKNSYYNVSDWKWNIVGPLNDSDLVSSPDTSIQAIQPTLFTYPDGSLQLLCRTKQDTDVNRKRIAETWSYDNGKTWSDMTLTNLPNPNAGTGGCTLYDKKNKYMGQLLVYNNSTTGRTPLTVAVSRNGKIWRNVLTIEDNPNGKYAYPFAIQSSDGLVHVVYSANDKPDQGAIIRHAVIDPFKF